MVFGNCHRNFGANIYNVFVHDPDITWKRRHVQYLLPFVRNNMQGNDLNVKPEDMFL